MRQVHEPEGWVHWTSIKIEAQIPTRALLDISPKAAHAVCSVNIASEKAKNRKILWFFFFSVFDFVFVFFFYINEQNLQNVCKLWCFGQSVVCEQAMTEKDQLIRHVSRRTLTKFQWKILKHLCWFPYNLEEKRCLVPVLLSPSLINAPATFWYQIYKKSQQMSEKCVIRVNRGKKAHGVITPA